MLLCFHQPIGQESCHRLIFCHDEQIPCDNCTLQHLGLWQQLAPGAGSPALQSPLEEALSCHPRGMTAKLQFLILMSGSPELGSSVSPTPPGQATLQPLHCRTLRLLVGFPFFFWGCSPALSFAVATGLRLLWMPTLCPKHECRASETEQGSPQVSKMNGAVCAKGHM